jgi:Spy/CpxP family protein refolding chaperone
MKELFSEFMRTLNVAALTAVLAAPVAFAQPAANPGPGGFVQQQVSFLTRLLSLTSAQQQQATTIFTAAANRGFPIDGSLRNAEQKLRAAERNNDRAGIQAISTTIGNLTAQMTAAESTAKAAFYQILTPDQQTKLNQFDTQDQGRFQSGPGPGPGGLPGRPH